MALDASLRSTTRTLDALNATLRGALPSSKTTAAELSQPTAVSAEKILRLLQHPHSADLTDRHLRAIAKYCQQKAATGVPLRQLPALAQVLDDLRKRSQSAAGGQDYVQPLCDLLQLLVQPLAVDQDQDLVTTQQVVTQQQHLETLVDAVMACLSHTHQRVLLAALDVAQVLAAHLEQHPAVVATDILLTTAAESAAARVGLILAHACAYHTQLMVHVAPALELLTAPAENAPSSLTANAVHTLQSSVLSIIRSLTHHQVTADTVVQHRVPARLCAWLASKSGKQCLSSTASMAIESLWNLLGGSSSVAATTSAQLCTARAAEQLVYILRESIMAADSQAEKEARNDVMVLAACLTSNTQFQPLFEAAHGPELISRFCVCGDVKLHHPDVRGLRFNNSAQDFEFMKLALIILCKFAESEPACNAMRGAKIMDLLMLYQQSTVDAAELPRQWTAPQFEELQLLALSCLNAFLPRMLDVFHANRGVSVLLSALCWALEEPSAAFDATIASDTRLFRGAGNAFHATGDFSHGRTLQPQNRLLNNGRRAQAQWLLKTLHTLAVCRDSLAAPLQQDALDQGLLQQLLKFLDAAVPENADEFYIRLRTYALHLCSALCKGRPHIQEIFGPDGTNILVPYLRFNIGLLEGQPARKVMLVAALDAVWSCVVGCSLTEKAFLQAQGVFLLLDALETCPAELHNIILGLLVDLCETDAALQHALAWQGQSDLRLNVVHVLLRVWSQACKSLRCQGVCPSDGHLSLELDEHGRWLPLAGQEQRQLMEASGAASRPPVHSAAVQDVLGTVRAKVHALCGRIGFARCFDMAGAEGRLALVAVEQYMNLKATEVWQEILHELKVENVAVVEYDALCLQQVAKSIEDLRQQLAKSSTCSGDAAFGGDQ